jgi:hypothetical protein
MRSWEVILPFKRTEVTYDFCMILSQFYMIPGAVAT